MATEKIKIQGAVLEIPAQTALPIQPIWPIFAVNGLDWQCPHIFWTYQFFLRQYICAGLSMCHQVNIIWWKLITIGIRITMPKN